MGQKVNPISFRLKINRSWDSIWYSDKQTYVKKLHEDLAIRKLISARYKKNGVVRVLIERFPEKVHLKIYSTKPGVVIGQKGKNIEALKVDLNKIVSQSLDIKILEVSKPDNVAQAISDMIATQIQDRIPFRRAMKQAMRSAIRSGVQGIRVLVSGRLNGVDMARSQQYMEGRVPLHTLRAMIDYAFSEADTTYGKIGVKVWVYNGDYFANQNQEEDIYLVKRREA